MLNDLPVDIDVIDEINISCLDPVLKNYAFSSFFLTRLLDKTMKENNELKKENAKYKAQLEEYAQLKKCFDELKKSLDEMGGMPDDSPVLDIDIQKAEGETSTLKEEGFMAQNRDDMEALCKENLSDEGAPDADLLLDSDEPVLDSGDISLSDEISADLDVSEDGEASADADILASLGEDVQIDPSLLEGIDAEPMSDDELLKTLGEVTSDEEIADVNALLESVEGLADLEASDTLTESGDTSILEGLEDLANAEGLETSEASDETAILEGLEALAEEPVAEVPVEEAVPEVAEVPAE